MQESPKSDSIERPSAAVSEDHMPPRELTPAAQRALAEAEERRNNRAARPASSTDSENAKEVGGPSGPEPIRYGDWEKGGIAWDF